MPHRPFGRSARFLITIAGFLLASGCVWAEPAVQYRLSFVDRVHHVMHVEVTFPQVKVMPLRVQMSRSSAGRYSAVEFAENVFEVHVTDGHGRALKVLRPNPREWQVAAHNGTVRISYDVFGDRLDGTYLAIDPTHAHVNFPAALMWAQRLQRRSARVTFVLPADSHWKVATQLYPTKDPLTFTAPNLQYLMDSPTELSEFVTRTFTVAPLNGSGKIQTMRVAMHYTGNGADLDAYVAAFQKVVREEQAIFGELPDFEPGSYTLVADYLPWATFDGMEHRNSSAVASHGPLVRKGVPLVGNLAHEFFHCWNGTRIRPASLTPFDFSDVNMSGELWLMEGFTNYYERLVIVRSGVNGDLTRFGTALANELGYVLSSPGGRFRSAVAMSRLAPFVDTKQGPSAAPTDWPNTFVSYYSFGDMIALGLDLTLRARSDSHISLDDFMRAMWRVHGKPPGPEPGIVGRPYTLADVRARLTEVSGDRHFADDFVRRYIEGTGRLDYAPLLLRAGFVLRKKNPEQGSLGEIRLEKKPTEQGTVLVVASPTEVGSPAYAAGLDLDDELLSVAGVTLTSPDDLQKALAGHRPGGQVELVFKRRGQIIRATVPLGQDHQLEIVPVESAGGTLTDAQERFRRAWLGSKVPFGQSR